MSSGPDPERRSSKSPQRAIRYRIPPSPPLTIAASNKEEILRENVLSHAQARGQHPMFASIDTALWEPLLFLYSKAETSWRETTVKGLPWPLIARTLRMDDGSCEARQRPHAASSGSTTGEEEAGQTGNSIRVRLSFGARERGRVRCTGGPPGANPIAEIAADSASCASHAPAGGLGCRQGLGGSSNPVKGEKARRATSDQHNSVELPGCVHRPTGERARLHKTKFAWWPDDPRPNAARPRQPSHFEGSADAGTLISTANSRD
ncbi:uncharacterized protein FIBRA_09137 [Fibroporia radiculosa]|uniref:Uncharacterized protein n=1 Tax=Fibroporia radiculosa TaxID=599839 RepID=J4H5J2_9APHY|nr:uncharacterized protein FIBRA_09137 [Fibroporia radiculosa]CCM06834.1 predicted protein [Fibroporia radiculosa]